MVHGCFVAICIMGATPTIEPSSAFDSKDQAQASARSLHALRKSYGAASKRVALSSRDDRDQAIRELTSLLLEVQQADHLPDAERHALRAQIRTRLQGISRDLKAELARAERAEKQPRNVAPGELNHVLAQRLPAMRGQNVAAGGQQGGAAQAARDRGQELIDLIQATIAPHTWDVNGGAGSIFYWQPGHALVVRGRGEVHEQLGGALGRLRRN